MKVDLFVPCFVDAFLPRVGLNAVRILERLGHEVGYPERQTCCGQPAFNAGFQHDASRVAEHFLDCFADSQVVVVPSASCAAMVKVHYPALFRGTPRAELARALAERTWELSEFLVERLEVRDVGARFPARVTFHDGCHGLRELGIEASPRTLLRHVRDLELVEMAEARSCCGFGGLFSVKHPELSSAMAGVIGESIRETGARHVVSNDPSCLTHLQGLLDRQGEAVECLHLSDVLVRT